MNPNPSSDSTTDSDVLYVERSSTGSSPIKNFTPAVLNSAELTGPIETESITISSVASPGPQIVTSDSDSNEPTIPNGYGSQHPIVPPSLNDLNLPHNSFNVLVTMAVIRADEQYSPQSPEPSIPSPISMPPMNVSTIEGWETPHTTTDDNTISSSENERRRVYWDFSPDETFNTNEPRKVSVAPRPSSTPPPPRRQKKTEHRDLFSQKKESVAAHLRGMRLTLTSRKDTLILRRNSNILYTLLDFNYNYIMYFN